MISTVFYRMKPDGSMDLIREVEKVAAEERPANKLLRFSPRSVTLRPNIEQVVRIMVRRRGNMTDGDYRAHIMFEEKESEGEAKPQLSLSKQKGKSVGTTSRLTPRMAVAIPITIRYGKTNLEAKISSLKLTELKNKNPAFELTLSQTGNQFAYGAFEVFFTPKDKKKAIKVGIVKGVSSYVPERNVKYGLNYVPDGIKLKDGKLRVEYRRDEGEGKELLASSEINL